MKLTQLLPFAAFSAAIVIPDENIMAQIAKVDDKKPKSFFERIPTETAENVYHSVKDGIENAIDSAFASASKVEARVLDFDSMVTHYARSWMAYGNDDVADFDESYTSRTEDSHPPHPPHPPHHRPHPPHHPHHKPTKSVYELIASSKYTTKFAKIVNQFPDLVEILNGTEANYTIFAPTDKAFEKLPEFKHGPSAKVLRRILAYHVSPELYTAGGVLASHTIPSTLTEEELGDEPQRIRVSLGFRGLSLNFVSRIIAVNIFGTNGVIHGIDTLLLPPPPAGKILSILPGQFSTLELALLKTGLLKDKVPTVGGTLFAPSNWAFQKLGPRANAFLFSSYGEKYLKALIQYHIVLNETLYSDAFYSPKSDKVDTATGHFHVDLPTLLKDKSLSVDVGSFGRLVDIRINAYTSVSVIDGIAKDGVIQVLSNVLIPPRTPDATDAYDGGEIAVDDLKQRLEPYLENSEEGYAAEEL